MGLVNDLLIEVDRRRAEAGGDADAALEGLSPAPLSARPRRRLGRGAPFMIGLSLLALGAAGIFQHAALWSRPEAAVEPTPPAVGARPSGAIETARGAPAGSPFTASERAVEPLLLERPARVSGVALERWAHGTRLRIVADRATAYRIEGAGTSRQLEIVLEAAALRSMLEPLDLLDTPIRSLQARGDGGTVRLALSLDEAVRVQSQWAEGDDEASLLIDLQSESRRGARVAGGASPSVDSPGESGLGHTDGLRSRAGDPDGGEGSLVIRRSEDDRRRRDLQSARARARESLAAARSLRDTGDPLQAIRLYRTALAEDPDLREATLELCALLAESGERSEAIETLRSARRHSPGDARLALLHAQLVAGTGDLAQAVEILDRSGLALTEAPEIHALAAAYAQQAGDHAAAIERYERIVRRFPSEASWWMGLGISLEAEGRRAEALDVYRIAMQVGELPPATRRWVSARVQTLGEEG